ncbi:MAG: hypothetical protein RLZZ01_344, partial [Actinomycetota bacterium]
AKGQRTLLPTLVAQGFIDGVIATAGPRSERLISDLRERGKNLVVIGHPVDDRDLRGVDVDSMAGSASAVDHLVRLGRQRIGFIGPTLDYLYGAERFDGFRMALASAGRSMDDRIVRLDEPTPEGGHRAALAVLRDRPDAIHVATDPMAVGVLRALGELGLRVPDDVAIVGFDGLPSARPTDPVLTTVVQPVVEVGRRAVHLLSDEDDDSTLVILPTALRIGGTCGARPVA